MSHLHSRDENRLDDPTYSDSNVERSEASQKLTCNVVVSDQNSLSERKHVWVTINAQHHNEHETLSLVRINDD